MTALSEAHAYVETLTVAAIRRLPGYDDAPWEITDHRQAFRAALPQSI